MHFHIKVKYYLSTGALPAILIFLAMKMMWAELGAFWYSERLPVQPPHPAQLHLW